MRFNIVCFIFVLASIVYASPIGFSGSSSQPTFEYTQLHGIQEGGSSWWPLSRGTQSETQEIAADKVQDFFMQAFNVKVVLKKGCTFGGTLEEARRTRIDFRATGIPGFQNKVTGWVLWRDNTFNAEVQGMKEDGSSSKVQSYEGGKLVHTS
ncbi:hypothetical protein EV361DRAFT_462717 [Lentinula raphanica]|uniref:Uncharacterized protein n=1 Tax=Lentinula raphanica TaxID=153919 RepID=A0AA38UCF0_9AGAR|nr:hypothetical protein F5878DRAFT_625133 [Lentinula raphanica]KAJ3967816.1 hypothetical protein EV361DRAFT_462717 [Lentinula raphanica]